MKLLAISVLVFLIPAPAHSEPAEDLLAGCRDIALAETSENKVTFTPTPSRMRCWAAFMVLQDVIRLPDLDGKTRLLRVCPSAESTRTQLVATFVAYLDKHPERRHEEFTFVALAALRAAFPCAQK